MERKWYKETFDPKYGVDKSVLADIDTHHFAETVEEKKSQAMSNVIEFLVWGILLTFCFFYLQTHPAEKISLFSWVEVMRKKVTVWFSHPSSADAELVEKKDQLEKTFQEIILLAGQNSCVEVLTKKNIEESFSKLKAMNLDTFKQQQKAYQTVIGLYYAKAKEPCDK